MLDNLVFNHQNTIHSMNTFPVNLTSPNHARFILIYSTLNSVHRVKSTSSPASHPKGKGKKNQKPKIHFAVIQVSVAGSFILMAHL